jgi:hypothetical protein
MDDTKADVLPVPVRAEPMVSRPCIIGEMACNYIGMDMEQSSARIPTMIFR